MKTSLLFENPEFVARGDELIGLYADWTTPSTTLNADGAIRLMLDKSGIGPEALPTLSQEQLADFGRQALEAFFDARQETVDKITRHLDAYDSIVATVSRFHNHPAAVESTVSDCVMYEGGLSRYPRQAASGYLSSHFANNYLFLKKSPRTKDSKFGHRYEVPVIGSFAKPMIRLAIGDPS